MAELRRAEPSQVKAVLRESHALWSGGLALEDYLRVWEEVTATSWGAKYATFHVWVDAEGTVLSSFKLYRPRFRCGDRSARAAVIGAVFTPRRMRRRGYAAAMLQAAFREGRDRGDRPALLFSDVGTRYYADLGFFALPAHECWGRLRRARSGGAQGYEMVPMSVGHMEDVCRAQSAAAARRDVAVERDPEHWEFLRVRAGAFFSRVDAGEASHRWQVALRRGRFAGYVITVEGRREWSVREVGAVDDDPQTLTGILRQEGAGAAERGARTVHAWLPGDLADGIPEWRMRREKRRRAIPMILPLGAPIDSRLGSRSEAAFIPFLDRF